MDHRYRFKLGDRVSIIYGEFVGLRGTVDSRVFQKTVDFPDEYSPGYHVVLDDERVVMVRWDHHSRVRSFSLKAH